MERQYNSGGRVGPRKERRLANQRSVTGGGGGQNPSRANGNSEQESALLGLLEKKVLVKVRAENGRVKKNTCSVLTEKLLSFFSRFELVTSMI
jgi:hypothetical protein